MAQQKFILQLQNVVKRFGGITASNNITINVPEGSIYGIIGPNGAGKTTFVKLLTGELQPTAGEIRRSEFSYVCLDQEYSRLDTPATVLKPRRRTTAATSKTTN